MKPHQRSNYVPALLAIALMGLTACESRRIDLDNVRAMISDQYAARSGVAIDEVRCPQQVPTREGHRFECAAVFAGGAELVIEVEQLGDTKLRWAPKEPLVWREDAKAAIAKELAKTGRDIAELTCPDKGWVDRGQSMTCQARDSAGLTSSVEYSLSETGAEEVKTRE